MALPVQSLSILHRHGHEIPIVGFKVDRVMWSPHLYRRDARRRGMNEAGIERALVCANDPKLASGNVPPLLTLGHLAQVTSVDLDYLRRIVKRKDDPYRVFRIRKQDGDYRTICVPSLSLLRIQRWVNRYILSKIKAHPVSFAYDEGCSPRKCAEQHLGCRWLIRLDVRRFFDSISEIRVYRVFRECGYGALVSFELARLCTRVYEADSHRYSSRPIGQNSWTNPYGGEDPWGHGRYAHRLARPHRDSRVGHLPQGAPTSPRLANLAFRPIDQEIAEAAADSRLTYTRYADDLYFSTDDERFTRSSASALIRHVSQIVLRHGLGLNSTKISVSPPGARRLVLGLLVDGDKPRLSKGFKRSLERHLHFIEKFGPVQHAQQRKFTSVIGMFEHLYGKATYARSIEPAFGEAIWHRLAKLDPKRVPV